MKEILSKIKKVVYLSIHNSGQKKMPKKKMLVLGKHAVISFQNTLPVSSDFQFTKLREIFLRKKIMHNACW